MTIPESVTSIEDNAFFYCSGLTSVTIPNSVKSIGFSAFCYCSKLTSVTIPNSVTSIGAFAFGGTSLTELKLESVTPQSFYAAFESSYDSALLIIPDNTAFAYAVTGWFNFKNIRYENGKESEIYDDNVFNYVYSEESKEAILVSGNYGSMTNTSIPESVPINGTFYYVKGISASAFKNCSELTSVTIPNSVTCIGEQAFSGCSGLTSVTIPNSVTSIGNFAFYGCI